MNLTLSFRVKEFEYRSSFGEIEGNNVFLHRAGKQTFSIHHPACQSNLWCVMLCSGVVNRIGREYGPSMGWVGLDLARSIFRALGWFQKFWIELGCDSKTGSTYNSG